MHVYLKKSKSHLFTRRLSLSLSRLICAWMSLGNNWHLNVPHHFSPSPSPSSAISSSKENLQFWIATRMYSFPLDGVIKSVTIISVSCAVLIRSEWNPAFSWPPSVGLPSIWSRVYFVYMTRLEMRAEYWTAFIFSSSSGKYFTGMPNERSSGYKTDHWMEKVVAVATYHQSW